MRDTTSANDANAAGAATESRPGDDPSWLHRFEVDAAHPAFDGHFPGRPILPGVALLAEVLEGARDRPGLKEAIGAAPVLPVVKFIGMVEPGASLVVAYRLAAKVVAWHIDDAAGRRVASGEFARADLASLAPLTSPSPSPSP